MGNLSVVESIFFAALEKGSPEERAAYLDEACGSDPELRRCVERLLNAHPKIGAFLQAPAAGSAATVDEPPIAEGPGSRIGPYKLLQQIGEGGMGAVFMAEQEESVRRLVALKIIKLGLDSVQVLARFEAERQALALMDHPNIAKVLDAGTTGAPLAPDGGEGSGVRGYGRPYFVMELVKGIPLTKYCDERRLSPRERLELFIPVCYAVQHAHQKGIIHRDLKPSNVLIALYDGKPVPKVIDFGVAKAMGQKLTERTLFTEFGSVVGTLEYMSPEQAELNQLDIDTRSDIYSLGVLLYELLTGSTPLDRKRLKEGAILETLRLIREEEPPRPSTRLSTSEALPTLSAQRSTEPAKLARLMRGELDWIVMKALEKDRNRRYETANGLALDIERYLHDEPVQAGPPSAGYRLRKFVKRNRGPVLAAAAVLLALVAGVIGTTVGLVQAVRSERAAIEARDEEARQRQATETERNRAVAAEAEARTNEQTAKENERAAKYQALRAESARHAVQIEQALGAWERHDVTEAERVLGDVAEPFQQTWEQRHLRDLCRRKALRLPGRADTISSVAISGDGQRIVLGCNDQAVKVVDAATGQEKLTFKGHESAVTRVALSGDSQRVVSGTPDGTITVWDAATGQAKLTFKADIKYPGDRLTTLAVSGDGRSIATGGVVVVKIWDADTGQEKFTLKGGHRQNVPGVAISRDGQRIVTGSWDTMVKVWDGATGQQLLTLEDFQGPGDFRGRESVTCVALSRDGQRIVAGGQSGTATVWDAATGQRRLTVKAHGREVSSLAFSGDGRRIVSGSHDRKVKVWDATTGQELLVLKGHASAVDCVAVSDDGRRIASRDGDGTVRVWDTATDQDKLTLERGQADQAVLSMAISADGQRVVAGGNDGTVSVWDAAMGRQILSLKKRTNYSTRVAMSADGQCIVEGAQDGTVSVWDVKTGREVFTHKGHPRGSTINVAFSSDGRRIVSCGQGGTIRVLDAETGQETLTLQGRRNGTVAFSGDGRRILSGTWVGLPKEESLIQLQAKVWDAATGQEMLTFEVTMSQTTHILAFSADGQHIAAGGGGLTTVKVWDLATGHEKLTLKGHADTVRSVAFSADGQRIVTGSDDKTVKVWDAATGQEKLTLKGHTGHVYCVAFSADGSRIVSGGEDGRVKVWEAPLANPDPRTPK